MGNNVREQNQWRSMPADDMAKALYPVAPKPGHEGPDDASTAGDDDQANNHGQKKYPGLINSTRTESYPDGSVKRGGSRAWRNNNPGNLEYHDQKGAIGKEQAGRFAKFATEEDGMNALKETLRTVYKGKLPAELTKNYAPPGDGHNDPAAYAKFLAKHGVDPKIPVDQQAPATAEAIKKQEGWIPGIIEKQKSQ